MRAKSLAEWKEAMRIRARINSNFTYADRAGNIFYVWNASIPSLPHASGGDTAAVPARRTSDVWTRYVPFDSLPQLLNPRGRLRAQRERRAVPHEPAPGARPVEAIRPTSPSRSLRLRSQLSLDADRQHAEAEPRGRRRAQALVPHAARRPREGRPRSPRCAPTIAGRGDARARSTMLAKWDNTAAPTSRGARAVRDAGGSRYTQGSERRHDVRRAVVARDAGDDAARTQGRGARRRGVRAGRWRRRRGGTAIRSSPGATCTACACGKVDVPVGGCGGALGCFRVLNFAHATRRQARRVIGGDGWVLAVEFGRRAARVLGARVRREPEPRLAATTATRRRCSRRAR